MHCRTDAPRNRRPRVVHRVVRVVRVRPGSVHALFEERLALFAALAAGGPVTWSGHTRSPLTGQTVYPPVENGRPLRTWVGVGGTPESVVRAARRGLPLMLAIIGGSPRRFAPYVDRFHRTLAQQGSPALPVGAHSPGHVAPTNERAREELWPHYAAMMTRIGAERGWPPMTRDHFERRPGRTARCASVRPKRSRRRLQRRSRRSACRA